MAAIGSLPDLEELLIPHGTAGWGNGKTAWHGRADEGVLDDAGMYHSSKLTRLRVADLTAMKIFSDGLKHFTGLKGLEEPNLDFTRVSDDVLNVLADLPRLSRLSLSFTTMSDKGLRSLSQSTLILALNVSGNAFTDHGISYLGELKPLRHFQIKAPPASSALVEDLTIYCYRPKNVSHISAAAFKERQASQE